MPTEKGLVGVGLADGKLLWRVAFTPRYNTSTPIVDGNKVYFSGSGQGTISMAIEKKEDGFGAREVWKKSQAPSQYNTPVLKDGLLYGIVSTGRRGPANLFCVNAQTGEVVWTDKTRQGDCGSILDAGSVLVALSSNSELVVFKPSTKAYEEVAKYKVADTATWAEPILSGNRVFVKDRDSLALWTVD